jgi:hypothetical protein
MREREREREKERERKRERERERERAGDRKGWGCGCGLGGGREWEEVVRRSRRRCLMERDRVGKGVSRGSLLTGGGGLER